MALSAQSAAHSGWQLPPALAPAPIHPCVFTPSLANSNPSSLSTDVDTARPPLCSDASSASSQPNPPLFVTEEVQRLPDPFTSAFIHRICCVLVVLVETLPDDGVASQALVLQRIIETIRVDGYRSCYYFKDRSLDELRTILQNDEEFSNAIRVFFGNNYLEFGKMILLVLRHLCRRPPSDRSRKVQFVDDDDMLEDPASNSATSSPRVYPPFVLDDVSESPDPFDAGTMIHLTVLAYQQARDLGVEPDGDVRVAQLLFDLLHQLGLIPSPSYSGVNATVLSDCVRRDTAFSEALRGLLGPDVPPIQFVERLFPILRYMWYSLLN
ncbi:hypothetical protein AURDEDRAFT_186735 [Auricularia subglabra TFB-10046 SS5]|nr:hypothetical protein AURDEDRAFT_186735 [Auricularia subglabra TFB-10046 SS5]